MEKKEKCIETVRLSCTRVSNRIKTCLKCEQQEEAVNEKERRKKAKKRRKERKRKERRKKEEKKAKQSCGAFVTATSFKTCLKGEQTEKVVNDKTERERKEEKKATENMGQSDLV